ncbi:hypothetical protein GOACH_57_00020 [Gordonia aichiensis NBRC 108223]|uniref:Uncharacterized protein n=1 Tax=Gordonia aichiensis NBRC 108223 TaxID=1220583 RepID=L7KR99_9ACTN|nr:hypothetical protein GOACH_57_00020 [Gordonia aichiensis NBRC 108223]
MFCADQVIYVRLCPNEFRVVCRCWGIGTFASSGELFSEDEYTAFDSKTTLPHHLV